MKKNVLISLIALAVSVVGLIVALAAWKQKKREHDCDDFDEELLLDDEDDNYIYSQDLEDDEDCDLSFEEEDLDVDDTEE